MVRPISERLAEEKGKREIASLRLARKRDEKHLQYLNKNLKITKDRRTGIRTPDSAKSDMTDYNRREAMALARQMVEEDPIAIALLICNINFVIGSGFKLSIQTKDKDLNRDIEKKFAIASQEFDIRGLRSFGGLLRMWQSRKVVDGDVFINPIDADGSIKIATYESDRCYLSNDYKNCGIDYNEKTGAPIRYHFGPYQSDKANKSAEFTKKASDIIPFFNFPQDRVERERGVSKFLQVLNLIKDIGENMDNMDLKLKSESFLGIIFTRKSTATPLFGDIVEETDEYDRPLVKLQHGLNLDLLEGEDAKLMESSTPGGNYVEYIRTRLRFAGLPFGAPLEFVFMDATETNYSGMQVLGQLFKKALIPQQDEMKVICSKIFKAWLQSSGLYTDDIFYSHSWAAPSVGLLNILTESKAIASLMGSKILSRQGALDYMGSKDDFDGVINQIANEQDQMDELGVTYALGDPGAVIANVDEATDSADPDVIGDTNDGN